MSQAESTLPLTCPMVLVAPASFPILYHPLAADKTRVVSGPLIADPLSGGRLAA